MNCPNCDNNITIKDWQDDEPFECPECGATYTRCVFMKRTKTHGKRHATGNRGS